MIAAYAIIVEPRGATAEFLQNAAVTTGFGILFCTLGTLIFERFGERVKLFANKRVFADILLFVLSASSYFIFRNIQHDAYVFMAYLGIMVAMFTVIVYFSDTREIANTFSYIFKNVMFNGFVCGIVWAGIALCIFAFTTLLFEFTWQTTEKIHFMVAAFIWIVLFLNLSLSAIPKKEDEALNIPNVFKLIVVYVMLPVYLLLIAILCAYLVRILIMWHFPAGQINWFASFASLFFVFFMFTLRQYEDHKLAKIFVKFGGFVLMPIIVTQFLGMYLRISAYGLTTARYVSLILNIFALLFAAVSIIRGGRYVKHMLLAMTATALLITITPLNALDVPVRNQAARLTTVLETNQMLIDGEIIQNADISQEDKIKITSAWQYLRRTSANTPAVFDLYTSTPPATAFYQIFGFVQQFEGCDNIIRNWGNFHHTYASIDVEAYREFRSIRSNHNALSQHRFDIQTKTEALFEEHGLHGNFRMEFEDENSKLLLTRISFFVENNIVTVTSYEGFLLTK